MLQFHTTRGRASSPRPSSDERELDAVCDTALVAGDGNGRHGSDDVSADAASNTDLANIEAWKLLGGLLSQIDSLGWSDNECLSWIRRNSEAIQNRSDCMTMNGNKRRAMEPLGLEGTKRPRLVLGLNHMDADTAVGADGSTATGDMDGDDDSSDWGASDDSDCFSVTSCDDENGDRETLATVFETLKERAARKMANHAPTQSSTSVTVPSTVSFQEPPPPYTSGANSPLDRGGLFSETVRCFVKRGFLYVGRTEKRMETLEGSVVKFSGSFYLLLAAYIDIEARGQRSTAGGSLGDVSAMGRYPGDGFCP
jgi:hypothetical protein